MSAADPCQKCPDNFHVHGGCPWCTDSDSCEIAKALTVAARARELPKKWRKQASECWWGDFENGEKYALEKCADELEALRCAAHPTPKEEP